MHGAGSDWVVELDRWATDLWFDFGIFLMGDNRNFLIANDHRLDEGPDSVA